MKIIFWVKVNCPQDTYYPNFQNSNIKMFTKISLHNLKMVSGNKIVYLRCKQISILINYILSPTKHTLHLASSYIVWRNIIMLTYHVYEFLLTFDTCCEWNKVWHSTVTTECSRSPWPSVGVSASRHGCHKCKNEYCPNIWQNSSAINNGLWSSMVKNTVITHGYFIRFIS